MAHRAGDVADVEQPTSPSWTLAKLCETNGKMPFSGIRTSKTPRPPAGGNPEVICTLHRGLIDGALAGTGYEVEDLTPFVEPALCVARLRRS